MYQQKPTTVLRSMVGAQERQQHTCFFGYQTHLSVSGKINPTKMLQDCQTIAQFFFNSKIPQGGIGYLFIHVIFTPKMK